MDILNFTKSKIKKDLLRLYFSYPEKKYYIRELGRILKRPAAYVRRELIKLEEEGLLGSEFVGKEKYYFLKQDYFLYKEIKSIVGKTIGVEGILRKALDKVNGIMLAFIFGSYAGESFDGLSDIDLMIIGSPDEDELLKPIVKAERENGREINYHIFNSVDFKRLSREKDNFISSVLKKPKIFLIGNEHNLKNID